GAVLDVANRLMRGRPGALQLRAAEPVRGVVAAPVAYDDDAAEAAGIADAVAGELAAGTAPGEIAVLYRVNEQAVALAAALAARGVVTRDLAGPGVFELPAVRQVWSLLAVHAQRFPEDPVAATVADAARDAGWTVEARNSRLPAVEWAGLDAVVRFAQDAP